MRYLQQEPLITTISDEEIADDAVIEDLFRKLCERQQTISIEFEDPDNSDHTKNVENARITAVHDDLIDIHAFFSNASAKYRNVPFVNVKRIKTLATKHEIAEKYKVSRWHMMDVAEIDNG